jgi:hypothetical protein
MHTLVCGTQYNTSALFTLVWYIMPIATTAIKFMQGTAAIAIAISIVAHTRFSMYQSKNLISSPISPIDFKNIHTPLYPPAPPLKM